MWQSCSAPSAIPAGCASSQRLLTRRLNVTALAQAVGISESAVSHHLRGLRQMRLVQARRDGKEVYYRLEDEHIIALFQQGVRHIQEG